jgi:hypothetical protein
VPLSSVLNFSEDLIFSFVRKVTYSNVPFIFFNFQGYQNSKTKGKLVNSTVFYNER